MHPPRIVQNHFVDGRAPRHATREFFGCAACVLATVAVALAIVLMLVRSCVMPVRAHPPETLPGVPVMPTMDAPR